MLIKILLGDGGSDFFTATINDSDFHSRWADELEWCLHNCTIDQLHTFSTFLNDEERKHVLIDSIQKINKFLKRNFIEIPEILDWDDQKFFNDLHIKFEQLSGEYGKPTKLFYLAPKEIKTAIRNLNYFIHTIESHGFESNLYLNFDKDMYRRKKLQDEDYEHFEVKATEPGFLYLGYCELGKSYQDLFKDGLPADYPGIKNLHYYSGEFFINLGYKDINFDKFKSWCSDNGIDYTNKKLGIGYIKLGKINEDLSKVKSLLKKHKYLYNIKVERNNNG